MIVVIDSTALAMLINPDANAPDDPQTGAPITHCQARIQKMCGDFATNGDILVIPTPVLAEVLVRAGDDGTKILETLQGQAFVRVKGFDQACAIEYAIMTRDAIAKGDKRAGHPQPWQRVKFDRQIVAIGRVSGAETLYSDDDDLLKFARAMGFDTLSTWTLDVPPVEVNLFTAFENPHGQ